MVNWLALPREVLYLIFCPELWNCVCGGAGCRAVATKLVSVIPRYASKDAYIQDMRASRPGQSFEPGHLEYLWEHGLMRHLTQIWQKEVDAMVKHMLPPLAMCKDVQSLRADATTTFLPAFFEAQKENSDPNVRMVCEYLLLKDLAD